MSNYDSNRVIGGFPMKQWLVLILLSLLLRPAVAQAQRTVTKQQSPLPTLTPGKPPAPVGQALDNPVLIPLAGTDQIQLKLVNCDSKFIWGIDCGLSRLLLPASTRVDQWDLQFENPAAREVRILNTAVSANGKLNSYQLTTKDTVTIPPGPLTLPNTPIVSLPLKLKRPNMPPNQYGGAVYLTLDGQDNRLLLPLDLRIRTGAALPVVVVLLGIILGRLLQSMQKQSKPQADAMQSLYRLQTDIKSVPPDDRRLLAKAVRKTRKLIDRQQVDEATTQISVIRKRLDVLTQLGILEDQLQQHSKDLTRDILEQAKQDIQDARYAIALERDAHAKETLDAIDQLLDSVAVHGEPKAEGLEQIKTALKGAALNLEQTANQLSVLPEAPAFLESLQELLIDLSGLTEQVRPESTFWFVRPLLYFTLLAGLSMVGINTLYVEKGDTFGARPLSDYLGLLLWGLSADVASRSLSSLQGKRE